MILTEYCSTSKGKKKKHLARLGGQGEGIGIAVLDGLATALEQLVLSWDLESHVHIKEKSVQTEETGEVMHGLFEK